MGPMLRQQLSMWTELSRAGMCWFGSKWETRSVQAICLSA